MAGEGPPVSGSALAVALGLVVAVAIVVGVAVAVGLEVGLAVAVADMVADAVALELAVAVGVAVIALCCIIWFSGCISFSCPIMPPCWAMAAEANNETPKPSVANRINNLFM
ncbi:MAG TPA: hypothetical protein VFI90_18755 [Rubrobacter sp.]|nr:hypothetical protein [Rubrobacter sp.]